jgi:hypothetical protein
MKKWTMAERQPGDGAVSASRPVPDKLAVTVTTDGKMQSLVMSEYNAARLFGMLALMLEIPLPRAVAKSVQIGGSVKAEIA